MERMERLLDYDWEVQAKLADIEKVFNYLDGGRTPDHINLIQVLRNAERQGITKKIKLKYFTVTFYKKGTCHIEFTNLGLLDKFNLFGSQRKGWLPPSYGKVRYDDMSKEEQEVIDSFQGKENYEKVLQNKDYYLVQSTDLLLLAKSIAS